MKSNPPKSLHPALETIALYSRGDLPLLRRWRMRRHIANCETCERQLSRFRSAAMELKREAREETLTAFEAIADWPRLEREMLGNIGVGISAARCIEKVRGSGLLAFPRALAAVGLVALFIAGWFTHIPAEQTRHLGVALQRVVGFRAPQALGTIVETTPLGIAVRAQGATLTMMHPRSAVISLAGSSAVAARYVDEETGQVTITNVYGQ